MRESRGREVVRESGVRKRGEGEWEEEWGEGEWGEEE